jgi:hypothetical protein
MTVAAPENQREDILALPITRPEPFEKSLL